MDNVERVTYAAERMRYHHDSDTRTIVAYVCGLQSSCERWTVPTTMDGRGAVGRGIEGELALEDLEEVRACVCTYSPASADSWSRRGGYALNGIALMPIRGEAAPELLVRVMATGHMGQTEEWIHKPDLPAALAQIDRETKHTLASLAPQETC